ncbi:hypothetical protein PF023_02065 [Enterococcus thailandicus]|uniref:hypothetical protein n=1 Tax=Enterococcus thailandicus TaxID=417368 RepID=UPI0022EBC3A9|nr:hypothetical protein [Enterococcus thailandicus]MDA3972819.1 hypothetical protein [Enterococcus thailandicus]MDA3975315.1 hypothetical protein [Enterococcus thailandicus]MDA3980279.1 hypothetical protein [Enterococcus thailandicus]
MAFSGCGGSQEAAQNNQFTNEVTRELKQKAKRYTEQELQNTEVPLHAFIQLEGKIIRSDGDKTILQGDRFILRSGSSKYQIFNEQKETISIGDQVTVYGEYYGFIKGIIIEKE